MAITNLKFFWTFNPYNPDGSFAAPDRTHPPAGWESKAIPTGVAIRPLEYESYITNYDDQGVLRPILNWGIAYFFLPKLSVNQKWCWLLLQPDSTYVEFAELDQSEAIQYTESNQQDGSGQALQLFVMDAVAVAALALPKVTSMAAVTGLIAQVRKLP